MPSSAIEAIEYDAGGRTLFVGGRPYAYYGVPEPLYRRFRAASSKGRFFNLPIRGRFPYAAIDRMPRLGFPPGRSAGHGGKRSIR